MTDLEKFLALIEGKAPYQVLRLDSEPLRDYPGEALKKAYPAVHQVVDVENSGGYTGYGYLDFMSRWVFDAEGNLLGVGHFE